MNEEAQLATQLAPYVPWLIIAGVFVLFILLRVTRKAVRQRIDEFGYRRWGDRGLLIWFWLNSPGVILHELSHALVILFFYPFGFRITSIALFRIRPMTPLGSNSRVIKSARKQSLQLGEVQYKRPTGRVMTHIGDGLSAVAPLIVGLAILAVLYWAATGYDIWEIHLNVFRPGWPWWTLLFAPYLILTVTSELWPSRQDWRGARYLLLALLVLLLLTIILLWLIKILVFNNAALQAAAIVALHIDYALLVLLALDIVFFFIAEVLVRLVRL